jgi:hypothetical protein
MDECCVRTVDVSEIVQAVRKLAMNTTSNVPKGAINALEDAYLREESPVGKEVIRQILENHRIAREESVPACQDTGVYRTHIRASVLDKNSRVDHGYDKIDHICANSRKILTHHYRSCTHRRCHDKFVCAEFSFFCQLAHGKDRGDKEKNHCHVS